MKKDDKVVCIKNYKYENRLLFEEDKLYKIISIYDDDEIIPEITVIYDNTVNSMNSVSFTKRFNQYFIGIKEQRKLKLKRINESR